MKQRNVIPAIVITVLIGVGLLTYSHLRRHPKVLSPPVVQEHPTNAAPMMAKSSETPVAVTNATIANDTNLVYRLKIGQVLVTVNGVALRLGDLVPLSVTNADVEQQITPEVYNYFLDRAVIRELTFQAAKAAGVDIDESQQQQLAKMRAAREQTEPGLLEKKTVDASQVEFELRDAQAFMLQTSLMAQGGFTPNVTPEQVQAYYQGHTGDFPALPDDPQAREDAWRMIDIAIRQKQASEQRADYNKHLTEYNKGLKDKAQISFTSVTPSKPL